MKNKCEFEFRTQYFGVLDMGFGCGYETHTQEFFGVDV